MFISQNVSAKAGSNTVIMCKGYGGPQLNIIWSQNGEVISNTTFTTIHEEYVNEKGRLLKQSSLRLSNLQACDSGEFQCMITDYNTSHYSSLWMEITGMYLLKQRLLFPRNFLMAYFNPI